MIFSPRAVAIGTLTVGAFTFAILFTQTHGQISNPLDANSWRGMAAAFAGPTTEPQREEVVLTSASTSSVPSDAPSAPTLNAPGPARPERLAQDEVAMPGDATPELSAFGLPCGLTVSAEALPAAMVALDIMDPCQPDARVVIEHSGLNLTGMTDAVGLLSMDIPAFEAPAFFTVRMPDGTNASSLAIIPDLPNYSRVAVQWFEDRSLELHAMEFGAAYGEPGHIWLENPSHSDRAVAGEGGFLVSLGDADVENPLLAQVYTFPRDSVRDSGMVHLTIEAPVTEANCAQPTQARTIETDTDGHVAVIELTFTLPTCDAVGDYLVLQNLLQDLRVAGY